MLIPTVLIISLVGMACSFNQSTENFFREFSLCWGFDCNSRLDEPTSLDALHLIIKVFDITPAFCFMRGFV